MSEQLLVEWKRRLENRDDLSHLYERKNLGIIVTVEDYSAWVEIHSGMVELHAEPQSSSAVSLRLDVKKDIAEKLFNGERKLTAFPADLASWKGRYRDCLLFETLLYLP
ncbi:hypothetical protein ERJ70_13500 [Sediminibacillus dalangtanensis]|uniref:SCP-2 sterol transfer family protein n=1 Tax=Sediminibacillus dalangtanensis TaxID=2729421 RepID=A0ABX7VUM1_9BACI|nr:hypothetical protein [Sediminibacillus dalangtanensis]QTN00224.1 hypothetical protein ERJ70_13500 [Sediminibacillus dalangtanensis]